MEYNIEKAKLAQDEFCIQNKLPHFAPFNGECYICGNNIYKQIQHSYRGYFHSTGIDIERASNSMITGCPHCSYSYCE